MTSTKVLKFQEATFLEASNKGFQFHSRLDLTYFLKFYLDAAYIFCLSPFRLSLIKSVDAGKNSSSYKFITKTWWPQKLLCATSAFLGTLWLLQEVRGAVPENPQDPRQYFNMALNLTDLGLKIVTLKKFWRNQTDFLKIANFIIGSEIRARRQSGIPGVQKRWKHFGKIVALFAIACYTGMGFLNWGVGTGVLATFGGGNYNWSLEWWWARMVNKGYENLFWEIPPPVNGSSSVRHSSADVFIGILSATGFFQRFEINVKLDNIIFLLQSIFVNLMYTGACGAFIRTCKFYYLH